MRDGRCPRCGSGDVYSNVGLRWKRGSFGSNTIPITAFLHEAVLENYVCVACGYRESYVADRGERARIREKWERVTG